MNTDPRPASSFVDGSLAGDLRRAMPRFLSRAPRLLAQAAVVGGAAVAGSAILGAAAVLAVLAGRRKTRINRLRGKTVLITGSSRGLGLAMAEEFARHGARIVLTARNAEQLERARNLLLERSLADTSAVLAIPADLRRQEDAEYLVHRVLETWGRIDVLVNNAGVMTVGPVESHTAEDFRSAMESNFFSALHCTLAALPHLLENRGSAIVNITSIGGKLAVPHLLPYTASKFAAVGFSQGLHAELRSKGVHVLTVCPGLIRTGSHLNSHFSGNPEAEYQWFSLAATTPVLAASARHAARRIVRGLLNSETEIFITPHAALAGRLAQVCPEFTATGMSLVSRVLPDPGPHRARRGAELRHSEPASARLFGQNPARHYNEIGDVPAR